jgi:hypothetical protein
MLISFVHNPGYSGYGRTPIVLYTRSRYSSAS